MTKTALITGASGGIGKEFARIYASQGYDLVLVARHEDALDKVASELQNAFNVRTFPIATDLSLPYAAEALHDSLSEIGISIHVLINSAGFGDYGKLSNQSLEKQLDMIAVNVTSLTQLTYYYLLDMLDQGEGKILNLASLAAFEPGPYFSVYFATKAYVLSFTEALSEELRETPISVMALCPGATETGYEHRAHAETSGMFKNTKVMKPDTVALYGFESLEKKKVVAIPGLMNKIAYFMLKLAPRKLTRKTMAKILK